MPAQQNPPQSPSLLAETEELLADLIREAKGATAFPQGQSEVREGREPWSIADRLKLVDISAKFIAAKQRIDAESGEDTSQFNALRQRLNRGRKTSD